MNYLAHIYLSGSNTHHALGNFIADDIKGLEWKKYPIKIQEGILLHRAIDSYTDKHALFKKHVSLLFPIYRHYSRVIVDMYYDHFLACYWKKFHPLPLNSFAENFYTTLENHLPLLPEVYEKRLPHIRKGNWFLKYASIDGLGQILWQMEQRTRFPSKLSDSISELKLHYSLLESDFLEFFPLLCGYCKKHPNAGNYKELPYFEI